MNQMLKRQSMTMSSREIAELTGSRHDAVRKSAERLCADQILTSPLATFDYQHRGNTYQEYRFNKRDSLVIVARLSPEFTAAVVDRWQELEQQVAQPFQLPKSMSEALRLAADQAEQIEQQQRALEQAQPAVDFLGRYVETGNTKTIREVAKILGLPEKAFIKAMEADKILYRQSGNLLPHQQHQAAKRFLVKTGERNGHAYTQTRVTSAGVDYLARVYGHWIGEAG